MDCEALPVDWERVETDYRAGVLSLREIASPHGITEGAIRKRAKRDGWERDLGAKIQAQAEALVRKQAVRSEVRTGRTAADRQIIEANAERIAQVRGEHRVDIERGRSLVLSLLAEVEEQTGDRELFAQLGEIMAAPDDKGADRMRDAYQRAIGLPGRVASLKSLSEAMKNFVGLEREAYGLDTKAAGGSSGSITMHF